jgi:hypothetical protein
MIEGPELVVSPQISRKPADRHAKSVRCRRFDFWRIGARTMRLRAGNDADSVCRMFTLRARDHVRPLAALMKRTEK